MKIVSINRNAVAKSDHMAKPNPSAKVFYEMLKQIDLLIESHQIDSTKLKTNESNRT